MIFAVAIVVCAALVVAGFARLWHQTRVPRPKPFAWAPEEPELPNQAPHLDFEVLRCHGDNVEPLYAGNSGTDARRTFENAKRGPHRGSVVFLHNGTERGRIG